MSPPNRRRGGARRGVCFRLPKRGPGRRYDVRLGVNHENGGHGAARPQSRAARAPRSKETCRWCVVGRRRRARRIRSPGTPLAGRNVPSFSLFSSSFPYPRYSIPRRGPGQQSTGQQNTPHVRPRVVSCCVRGRRGTNEVDARLETENRQPSRYRRYRKTESESRGAARGRGPAACRRVPAVGSCLSKKPNYRKATHRTLLKGRPSTRIFILVPCFRTTSRGGSSPTRSPQAAQQLHLQCTAASCTQLQPW